MEADCSAFAIYHRPQGSVTVFDPLNGFLSFDLHFGITNPYHAASDYLQNFQFNLPNHFLANFFLEIVRPQDFELIGGRIQG